MRWAIRFIGLANTAIIARLLTPEDFGLVALAMIAVEFAITVTDGDIDMAIVRSRDASRDLTHTGWTLKVIVGVLTTGALMVCAPLVAEMFGDQRLTLIVRIAAMKPIILGFENIGVTEFRRKLNFQREFHYLVIQRIATFGLGLVLAFSFRNYFALACAGPVSAVVTIALSYLMVRSCPHLALAHWRELWAFSRWQMLFNTARLLGDRCDQVAMGQISGVVDTGVYAVGSDLALIPSRDVMLPAGRALMPTYATVSGDPAELNSAFCTVLGFAVVAASSLGLGLASVAGDAVKLILGNQWIGAVPFVKWLAVYAALEGIWLMLDPFLIAAHKERLLALSNVCLATLTVPAVVLGAQFFGVSWIPGCRIVVIFGCLVSVMAWLIFQKLVSLLQILDIVWRPVTAAIAMVLAVGFFRLDPSFIVAFSLIHDVFIGAATYGAALLLLWFLAARPEGVEQKVVVFVAPRLTPLIKRLFG